MFRHFWELGGGPLGQTLGCHQDFVFLENGTLFAVNPSLNKKMQGGPFSYLVNWVYVVPPYFQHWPLRSFRPLRTDPSREASIEGAHTGSYFPTGLQIDQTCSRISEIGGNQQVHFPDEWPLFSALVWSPCSPTRLA